MLEHEHKGAFEMVVRLLNVAQRGEWENQDNYE
jgi:hypothetical protein